jgi:hypothetical protein
LAALAPARGTQAVVRLRAVLAAARRTYRIQSTVCGGSSAITGPSSQPHRDAHRRR